MKQSNKHCYQLNWLILLFQCLWRMTLALNCDVSISGSPVFDAQGQIAAPSFPASYPREDTFYYCTYTLTNLNTTGAISLVFDDFHLEHQASQSFQNGTQDYLQIDLRNGQTPSIHTVVGRPGTILSPGSQIVLTLGVQPRQADSYSGVQTFSARYSFLTGVEKLNAETIYRDFGTVVPGVMFDEGSLSNAIQAPEGYLSGLYSAIEVDVIWYIEGDPHYKILFVIRDFVKTSSEDTSKLEVRDGLTSEAEPLYLARNAMEGYHMTSSQEVLYVRWKGTTVVGASLRAEFTYYTEKEPGLECPPDYFTCDNNHCILEQLTCNQRDNCGDTTDEDYSSICKRQSTSPPACDLLCLNGGVCVAGICRCPDTFYGDVCQSRNTSNSNEFTDLQHTSIMIGAFVGAVCLLSVCWLIAMAKKRYQDEELPQGGRINRIVSVHTPEDLGLRRNTTVVGEQDIPPDYSIVCRRDSRTSIVRPNSFARRGSFPKRYRPSIDSMGPLSPPPSYDIVVTGAGDFDDNDGIIITIPESAEEERNLPDVVTSEQTAPPLPSHSSQLPLVSSTSRLPRVQVESVNEALEVEAGQEAQQQPEGQDEADPSTLETTHDYQNTLV